MPNHVTNIITINGDFNRVNELLKFIKGKDENKQAIDFNSIISTPSHIFQGSLGRAEEEKYGKENCWYEWNIKNWGTKWNAYDVSIGDNQVHFNTAWSTPLPIFRALAEKFPDLEIYVKYADEDFGCNCGEITYYNNAETINIPASQSTEAMALAADVLGYDPRDEAEGNNE